MGASWMPAPTNPKFEDDSYTSICLKPCLARARDVARPPIPTAVSIEPQTIVCEVFTCSNDRDAQIKDIFGGHAGFSHVFAILFYVGVCLIKQASACTRRNRGARDDRLERGESVTNKYTEPLVEPTCARNNRHSSAVELRSSFGNDISPVAVLALHFRVWRRMADSRNKPSRTLWK